MEPYHCYKHSQSFTGFSIFCKNAVNHCIIIFLPFSMEPQVCRYPVFLMDSSSNCPFWPISLLNSSQVSQASQQNVMNNFYPFVKYSTGNELSSVNWSQQTDKFENVNKNNTIAFLMEKVRQLEKQNLQLKEKLQKIKIRPQRYIKRTIKRRKQEEIKRNIDCPYLECKKSYASEIALNLHIKVKHRGGTKKQRQKLAKSIILAQKNQKPLPESFIQLPPGYLEEFKEKISQYLEDESQVSELLCQQSG